MSWPWEDVCHISGSTVTRWIRKKREKKIQNPLTTRMRNASVYLSIPVIIQNDASEKKLKPIKQPQTDHSMYVVSNCLHGTNIISDGYLWSSENCISKFILHLGLNISVRLNEMLLDAFVIYFLALIGRLRNYFWPEASFQHRFSRKMSKGWNSNLPKRWSKISSINKRCRFGEIFSSLALIPVWKGGGHGWRAPNCEHCFPFLSNDLRPKVIS